MYFDKPLNIVNKGYRVIDSGREFGRWLPGISTAFRVLGYRSAANLLGFATPGQAPTPQNLVRVW